MINLKFISAVKDYFTRVFGYDSETRAVFLCMAAALINAVLCVITVFAVAVYLLIHKRAKLLTQKGNRSGFIFGALTLLVSSLYLNYFGIIASVFVLAVILITLSFRENITKQKTDDIFTMMVAYSVFAFAVAVVQKILNLSAIEGRSASTFLNALYYCYYVSFVIVICLYRVIYENRNKLLYILLAVLNTAAILVTSSKMPLVGVAVATFVMLLFAKKYKILIPFCIIGAAGVLAVILFHDTITEKLHMNSFIDSFIMRFEYWEPAIKGFLKKPLFGHGMLGILKHSVDSVIITNGYVFDLSNLEASLDNLKHVGWHLHAHNILFESLYSFGLVGTITIVFTMLKRCRELYIQSGRNILDPMMTFTMSCLAFILVDGIVDCQIIGIQSGFISIFLLSVTGVYKNRN
ncbi:MAG: O-antigen ligase family protein [Acutalibacteraceae bacterium]